MSLVARLQISNDWRIYFAVENGKDRVAEFIRKLDGSRPELQRRLIETLQDLAAYGPPKSPVQFRWEANGIFAVKEGQARLYGCFQGRKIVILSHGAIKKAAKADSTLLREAVRIKAEFDRMKSAGIDPFVEE